MNRVQDHPDSRKLLLKMRKAGAPKGTLNFQEFTRLALYDPDFGYYRKNRTRVGRTKEADFYTSQSLGPVFGALVTNAIRHLLKENSGSSVLKNWTLVEIGYESDADWWNAGECPFGKVVRIGPGDPINFSGNQVVFSNELFDAQPFHRIAFLNGRWRELGVDVSANQPREILLPQLSPEVRTLQNQLPLTAEEGYLLDLPLRSRALLKELTDQNWSGLFIALDYGKSWESLANDLPRGTARAYYQHKQSPHLLNQPGMQDLTCHICWDWLKTGLESAGFENIALDSQEAFFVKYAIECIRKIVTTNVGNFDPARQSLMHLIHPATMGQQFQVLSGYRPDTKKAAR